MTSASTPARVRVAIVGTGFSGLAMAVALQNEGIDDFVLLERGDAIGGTWRDNTYPGCACDIPSHLYSLSFAPSAAWTRAYAPQPEIRAYLERVATEHDLHRKVRFHTKIVAARFDEERGVWRVTTDTGDAIVANALVTGIGGLSNPAVPKIAGEERFRGPRFHSAAWRHDVDLRGKRVAVVGTGASAIQFVPEIQRDVAHMTVFQRTPPWVLPRMDRPFSPLERAAFEHVPGYRALHRAKLYAAHELRHVAFSHPSLMKMVVSEGKKHIARGIADPELRRKVTPNFTPGCKRILMSNDWYPALAKPNVEVETDAIAELREDAVVTKSGRVVPVDVVIYGTGFTVHDYLGGMTVEGRRGEELGARWGNASAEAYLGTTVAGFPNLFMLTGPNTGLGHNSMVVMIEAQVRYVMQALRLLRDRDLSSIEVRADVQRRYNERIQERLSAAVWSSGCASWYLDVHGKNTTLWPGTTAEFALRLLRLRSSDFDLVRARDRRFARSSRPVESRVTPPAE